MHHYRVVWERSAAELRPFQSGYFQFVGGIVARQLLFIAGGFSLVWLLRMAQPGSETPLWVLIAALLVFDVGLAGLDRLLGLFFVSRLSIPLFRRLRLTSLEKVLSMPMEWHHARNGNELVSKLNIGAGKVVQTAETIGRELVPALIRTAISFIPLLWLSAWTAPIVVVGLAAFLWLTARENRERHPYRTMRHEQYARESGFFTECVQNVQAVVQFGQTGRMVERYDDLQRGIVDQGVAEMEIAHRFAAARAILIAAVRRISQGIWIWQFQQHRLDIAMVMYLNFLTDELIGSFATYAGVLERLYEGVEPARTVAGLLNEESQDQVHGVETVKHVPEHVCLEFRDVNFSYQTGPSVLKDINLRIEPGTVLGIVGGTGIGKTTMQHLLSRVLELKLGDLLVAGHDVRDWSVRQLRSLFVSVSQNGGVLFSHNTVLETIRFGRPDATLEEAIEAAKAACIHSEIMRMPLAYDTILGAGGIHLSKGQQQRIGLAQAVLALPTRKVVILDEFTSALDSRTEQQVIDNLRPLLAGKTVIIIAHRLATLRKLADRIVVLERGGIVEDGSHAQLLAMGEGRYAELVRLQQIA